VGGTAGGVRFSPLKQIDRGNVARLEPAWTYRTGELALGLAHSASRASFNTTPLVVRGLLYLSTPSSRVIALEARGMPKTGIQSLGGAIVTAGGLQYVVIAAGGGGISRELSRTLSDTVLAFALPPAGPH